ncbi:MAG TPA: copper homeostasis protein CutC [Thermomicrobiales bacterium]
MDRRDTPATGLEVIVMSEADALAAERGGADRLEVVSAIEVGGLTPSRETFTAIRAATRLPLRVMLRPNGGYGIDATELIALRDDAAALRQAGAESFVCGFLTGAGMIDRAAMLAVLAAIGPCPWTFHRAFDHAPDPRAAWATVVELGADLILSSGTAVDLPVGLPQLCARASWQTDSLRWLVGGGLTLEQIPVFRAAGITQFHAGRAVRVGASWDAPIDEAAVRAMRRAIRGR